MRDSSHAPFAPVARAVAVCVFALLAADPALAFSRTSHTHFYDITGSTAGELQDAMARKGPHGYWAYTTWYVHWSADCEISVTIDYTMPRWLGHDAVPAALRDAWDRMMKNLWTHERGHAEHGFKAAGEIEASHCAGDPHRITDKWAEEDKVFDEKTDHGARQGVRLPDSGARTSPSTGQSSSQSAQP